MASKVLFKKFSALRVKGLNQVGAVMSMVWTSRSCSPAWCTLDSTPVWSMPTDDVLHHIKDNNSHTTEPFKYAFKNIFQVESCLSE